MFSTGDLVLTFPSSRQLWDATTAYAWSALRPGQPDAEQRIDFRKAARTWFDSSLGDVAQLDDQHSYLVVVTLARFLWSIKELQVSPLMDAGPEYWPLVEHKKTLLNKLDQFLAASTSVDSAQDIGCVPQITLRNMLIHLCHLNGAGDLMDWLPALLRSSGRHPAARARMSAWALNEHARVREVAYHSAQILSLCRKYPFNFMCESFYPFYAGAALWCTSILLPKVCQPYPTEPKSEPVLFLDQENFEGSAESQRIQDWLRNGGGSVVGVYGVPKLGSIDSRIQILEQTASILNSMRTWQLSAAFSAVIRKLIKAELVGQEQ